MIKGLATASGGSATNFLRADASWAAVTWANLAGKPTTVAGFVLIDAVDLASTQTITGARTFSTAPRQGAAIALTSTDDLNAITQSGLY